MEYDDLLRGIINGFPMPADKSRIKKIIPASETLKLKDLL